jgi:hypothetical protein
MRGGRYAGVRYGDIEAESGGGDGLAKNCRQKVCAVGFAPFEDAAVAAIPLRGFAYVKVG